MVGIGKSLVAAVGVAAVVVIGSVPAFAKCTRLAYSVNDYGKEGPARDAQAGLDKYIAKWANDNGIKGYTTGKKNVSCELYLDFGVFDEHTCKADALVCWSEGGSGNKSVTRAETKPDAAPASKAAAATPAAKPVVPAAAVKAKAAAVPTAAPAAVAAPAEAKISIPVVNVPAAPFPADSLRAAPAGAKAN